MTSSSNALFLNVYDVERIRSSYETVISKLVASEYWKNGAVEDTRVPWFLARQARNDDTKTFSMPGLYLWGVEDRPLYIGITRGTFNRRFSRYIWSARSQCNLAKDFESSLKKDGIDGFSPEIHTWYAKSYRGSKVRLRGAARFASEGIDKVWFALFPHTERNEIVRLEKSLVPIAEEWNRRKGFESLLNVEFKSSHLKETLSLKPEKVSF